MIRTEREELLGKRETRGEKEVKEQGKKEDISEDKDDTNRKRRRIKKEKNQRRKRQDGERKGGKSKRGKVIHRAREEQLDKRETRGKKEGETGKVNRKP